MNLEEPSPKVSLIKMIEKILGNEQLERDQHRQYIYYLLDIAPKQHLDGLSLDELIWDIAQPIPKPEITTLVSSRANKISEYPTIWYIHSIYQLQELPQDLHQRALHWNIITLKAAIYLIALPDLKSQKEISKEDKKQYKEHISTIKRLFHKFRQANKILAASKSYKKGDAYHNLWTKHLPSPEITLENFVLHLEKQTQLEQLDEFEKALLNDLRIIFNYVLKQRIRIGTVEGDKKLEFLYLDEEKILKETRELPATGKSYGEKREQLLDNQESRQIQVDLENVSPLASNSDTAAAYLGPIVSKHIQRREHAFTCSSLFPNEYSLSALLTRLYQDYLNNPSNNAPLIVLLSFVTGNSASEWLSIQNNRVKRLNKNQKLTKKNDQFFLHTCFSIFYDPHSPYPAAFQNQTTELYIPIPNTFILALKNNNSVDEKQVNKYLNKLRKKVYVPHLSLIKVSSLLHHTVLNRTGNKQLADILTGENVNHSSSLAYCHYPLAYLKETYVSTLHTLCQQLADHYRKLDFSDHQGENFGSIKAPTPQIVKEIFAILQYNIFSQNSQDWFAIFNHYNLWMWHFLLLFTAARPVRHFPGFLKHCNLEQQILIISDKETGGRRGHGRLIPFGTFIKDEIVKFIRFLEFLKQELSFEDPKFAQYIQDILDSKIPLLNCQINKKLYALRPSLVKQLQPALGLQHDNWHRHTSRAFLTQKLAEPAILALFAHEPMQQEAAHLYSSFKFSDYKQTALQLESMKDYFQITGIELDDLIA